MVELERERTELADFRLVFLRLRVGSSRAFGSRRLRFRCRWPRRGRGLRCGRVSADAVTTGAEWIPWSTDSLDISMQPLPMQPLRFDEEFDAMMSANDETSSFRK
jgi:hypothetical protein